MVTGIPERLQTDRLILRQFQPEDYDAYKRIVADPEVMRFVGSGKPMTPASAWQNIALMLGHWQMKGYGLWAVERQGRPGLIGRVGLFFPEGWPGLEIGWLLHRDFWGRGYASEAARMVRNLAFETMPGQGLISLIHPRNLRSVRVAESLGGKSDGQMYVMQQKVNVFRYEYASTGLVSRASVT
ncbi:GNAT family N-acetyltransferase [Hahella ganghwensis]|uniref:GNAT family N-acetyltransferase n=1 Tax=Hahella ganghwensis TaxID=286420 RepID=UPI00036BDBA7|nr:GNAT family N-acetyltransferase [Hahella ganghwensis]